MLNQTSSPEELSPPMVAESTGLSRLVSLEKKMNEFSRTISLLEKKNFMLEKLVTSLRTKAEENERYIVNQDIYSRRNNVEFCNISENVSDDQLEDYILKLLNSFNFRISNYDIVDVLRIGKKKRNRARNVIVRFLNRKDAFRSLKLNYRLKSSLQYKTVFVTENLCPFNKRIFNALYKLKKSDIILSVWVF